MKKLIPLILVLLVSGLAGAYLIFLNRDAEKVLVANLEKHEIYFSMLPKGGQLKCGFASYPMVEESLLVNVKRKPRSEEDYNDVLDNLTKYLELKSEFPIMVNNRFTSVLGTFGDAKFTALQGDYPVEIMANRPAVSQAQFLSFQRFSTWTDKPRKLKNEVFQELRKLETLKGLAIDGYEFPGSLLSEGFGSSDLRYLELKRCEGAAILEGIGSLNSLQGLSLRKTQLSTDEMERITQLKNLIWLDMADVSVPPEMLRKFSKMESLKFFISNSVGSVPGFWPREKKFFLRVPSDLEFTIGKWDQPIE